MPTLINPFVFVEAGSQIIAADGTFTVPEYNRLEVAVWGGGGGGGRGDGQLGSDGGDSEFSSATPVIGGGGKRGETPTNGDGGTASGGDSNVSGEAGGVDSTASGGDAASGSGTLLGTLTGGPGGTSNIANGTAPGGGASRNDSGGGNGGGGALAVKLWNAGDPGAPSPGTLIGVSVGSGGSGFGIGSDGGRGEVQIAWD